MCGDCSPVLTIELREDYYSEGCLRVAVSEFREECVSPIAIACAMIGIDPLMSVSVRDRNLFRFRATSPPEGN